MQFVFSLNPMAASILLLLSLLSITGSMAVHGGGISMGLIRRRLSSGNASPKTAQSRIRPDNSQFLMKIAIGTPPVDVYAILDTGSDLFWTQCEPCVKCYQQKNRIFDSTTSSSFQVLPCQSPQCRIQGSGAVCSGTGPCKYSYGYGGGLSEGNLATETMAVVSKSGETVKFNKVAFGCGHNNSGAFNENEMGLMGFGRGPVSFISQIGPSVGGRKFSLCLMPFNTNPDISATVSFGAGSEVRGPDVVTLKLVPIPDPTYYAVTLTGISVGETLVPFTTSGNPEKGNMIIDSGVPPTLLPQEFYGRLAAEVKRQIPSPPVAETTVCYKSKGGFTAPPMTLHFDGGLSLPLSTVQTFTQNKDGSFCFVGTSSPATSGIIGNFMQANFLVGYDIDAMTVSFKATDCTKTG